MQKVKEGKIKIAERYICVLKGATIVSAHVVDEKIAESCIRQLRGQGRSVRTFRTYEDYAKFLDEHSYIGFLEAQP